MENAVTIRSEKKLKELVKKQQQPQGKPGVSCNSISRMRRKEVPKASSLAEEMMRACQASDGTTTSAAANQVRTEQIEIIKRLALHVCV